MVPALQCESSRECPIKMELSRGASRGRLNPTPPATLDAMENSET
jgi:hypothetical protein